jgi:hypothetical protein
MSELCFRPLPTDPDVLEKLAPLWGQFLPAIADRGDETLDELIDLVIHGTVQVGLVWDGKRAHALIGIIRRKTGREIIGEVHWATGFGSKDWQHLLPELERYLKETGCTLIKPICRPGWQRLLKAHGYKRTHVLMEKSLW